MSTGTIIFLNGASSSGKTSIARALQALIEKPCIHLSIDDYLAAIPDKMRQNQNGVPPQWPNIIRGFHAAGAAIAREGNQVILDDVLETEPPWAEKMVALFSGIKVVFVGVHCPLPELERRGVERGDRRIGLARIQYEQVHTVAIYDIEVNTSLHSPGECAKVIVDRMSQNQPCLAFDQLRKSLRYPQS